MTQGGGCTMVGAVTRINLGIEPRELCDQHLLAEYRELPRLFGLRPVNPPPVHFKLGAGHVLWCAQFPRTLADRFAEIVVEFEHRGFTARYRAAPEHAAISTLVAPAAEVARARPLLIERIVARLAEAKRTPRWTRRSPPPWALPLYRPLTNPEPRSTP